MLLLEAGGKDNYHWIHIPVGYLYLMGNPRTDWGFRTAEEPGLNGRSLAYPRGKVLGGCSSINGMIYMRGQREDYDDWARVTNDPSWAWQNVLPVFRRSEDYHGGASEFHQALLGPPAILGVGAQAGTRRSEVAHRTEISPQLPAVQRHAG